MKNLILKGLFIQKLNSLFQENGYLYFANEIFQNSGAMEPYLDSHRTTNHHLSTSPEFFLKKVWAALYQNESGELSERKGIYTISSSFRREKTSALHSEEFTMAEWYRHGNDYASLSNDILSIINLIYTLPSDNPIRLKKPETIPIISFPDALYQISEKRIDSDHRCSDLINILQDMNSRYGQKAHIPELSTDNRHNDESETDPICLSDIFSLLMDVYLIPLLTKENTIFCMNEFPAYTRGMSRLNADGWAKRIECYIHGIEIANGYDELYESDEIHRLWQANNRIREALSKNAHPIDINLLRHSATLRNVNGMALGIERLLMATYEIKDIRSFFLND